MKKTLRIGIASLDQIKQWTLAVARARDPKVWFTSAVAVGKVLSAENRGLLRTIAEQEPDSLEELARLTGRQKVQPVPNPEARGGLRLRSA